MITKAKAHQIRKIIEKASLSLDDSDAVEAVELFPEWAIDIDYTAGFRTQRIGKLYKCIQSHRSQANWTPENTPALWKEVAKPGEIPVWKQPTGAHDAYMKGDKVWYPEKNTTVYVSIIDNNVWQPGVYGWEEA